jgi:cytoskeleton protein RodZ
MASESAGEALRGIGARLRAARERKGLTVLQAAEKLHADARILESLEAEDFAVLGAEVYVRGHLRRYAELLGESPEQLQELYAGSRHGLQPDLTRIPRGAGHEPLRLPLPALLGLAGFVLAALLWWWFGNPAPSPQPLAAAAPAADSAAPAGAPASATQGATRPDGAGRETQLTLRFSALSWVEVSDSSGRQLLQGLYAADAARTLSGEPPLRVVVGNAPAVDLSVNGQPLRLAELTRRDGSARLLIDAAGHASVAPPRAVPGD